MSESNRVLNAPGHTAILRNPTGLARAKKHLFELLDLTQFCSFLGFLSWDFHRAFKIGPMFFWSKALGPRGGGEGAGPWREDADRWSPTCKGKV